MMEAEKSMASEQKSWHHSPGQVWRSEYRRSRENNSQFKSGTVDSTKVQGPENQTFQYLKIKKNEVPSLRREKKTHLFLTTHAHTHTHMFGLSVFWLTAVYVDEGVISSSSLTHLLTSSRKRSLGISPASRHPLTQLSSHMKLTNTNNMINIKKRYDWGKCRVTKFLVLDGPQSLLKS